MPNSSSRSPWLIVVEQTGTLSQLGPISMGEASSPADWCCNCQCRQWSSGWPPAPLQIHQSQLQCHRRSRWISSCTTLSWFVWLLVLFSHVNHCQPQVSQQAPCTHLQAMQTTKAKPWAMAIATCSHLAASALQHGKQQLLLRHTAHHGLCIQASRMHLLNAREMMEDAVLLRRAADGRGMRLLAAVTSSPSMATTEPGSKPRE